MSTLPARSGSVASIESCQSFHSTIDIVDGCGNIGVGSRRGSVESIGEETGNLVNNISVGDVMVVLGRGSSSTSSIGGEDAQPNVSSTASSLNNSPTCRMTSRLPLLLRQPRTTLNTTVNGGSLSRARYHSPPQRLSNVFPSDNTASNAPDASTLSSGGSAAVVFASGLLDETVRGDSTTRKPNTSMAGKSAARLFTKPVPLPMVVHAPPAKRAIPSRVLVALGDLQVQSDEASQQAQSGFKVFTRIHALNFFHDFR